MTPHLNTPALAARDGNAAQETIPRLIQRRLREWQVAADQRYLSDHQRLILVAEAQALLFLIETFGYEVTTHDNH